MKNFPTDIAKTHIKRDKFPISPLFLCDFEEYFPTLSICGEFLHSLRARESSRHGWQTFTRHLTTHHGIATIPLSPFYQTPLKTRIIRFCFAKQDEILKQAAEILWGI